MKMLFIENNNNRFYCNKCKTPLILSEEQISELKEKRSIKLKCSSCAEFHLIIYRDSLVISNFNLVKPCNIREVTLDMKFKNLNLNLLKVDEIIYVDFRTLEWRYLKSIKYADWMNFRAMDIDDDTPKLIYPYFEGKVVHPQELSNQVSQVPRREARRELERLIRVTEGAYWHADYSQYCEIEGKKSVLKKGYCWMVSNATHDWFNK